MAVNPLGLFVKYSKKSLATEERTTAAGMSPLFDARASMEAKRIKSGQSNCPEKEEREITQDRISGNKRRWEAAQRKSAGN